jgi:hypothetical protein
MQAIMEPIFEIPYLNGVVILGVLIVRMAKGNKQFIVYGAMAIILGCGDAFHLVPRMYALLTDGIENHVPALGFGKMVTSITMTVFYVMLYHVWRIRYSQTRRSGLTVIVHILAIIRIVLCLLPQNRWLSTDAPLIWGIYRNIPFVILGIIVIVVFFRNTRKDSDTVFRFMWLAIVLSFAFYIPVVLWADTIPIIGILMIPKTCAYVWIVLMGYTAARKSQQIIL